MSKGTIKIHYIKDKTNIKRFIKKEASKPEKHIKPERWKCFPRYNDEI